MNLLVLIVNWSVMLHSSLPMNTIRQFIRWQGAQVRDDLESNISSRRFMVQRQRTGCVALLFLWRMIRRPERNHE